VRDFHWIDPEFVSLVAAHRLDVMDGRVAPDVTEGLITVHRGRVTIRRQVTCDDGSTRTVYVKREKYTPLRCQLGHLLAGRGLWTRARAEFEMLRQLRAAGFRCPRPIACVERGWPLSSGMLVLDDLTGTQPLNCYLAGGDLPADPAGRQPFFVALGREIARLHGAGFRQPDLYSNHVHVNREGAGWGFAFLDFQRSNRSRRVALRRRAADLGALVATLPPRLASQHDVDAFLDAYLTAAGLHSRTAELRSGVDDEVARLLRLRKIWEVRESDTSEHRAVQRLEILQAGTMWIDRHYRPQLESAGLANFEALMATSAGRLLRALPDRENWRLDLAHPGSTHRGAYLKKHHVRTTATRLRGRWGAGPGDTPGRVEARNVARLARGGIAAMRLIAFGEKLHHDGLLESFVLTEELVGYQQLDHFLRQRFAARRDGGPRDRDLRRLIGEVAAVAARFHQMGYNHRDLYCCHFFIKENSPGEFHVNLIDLQRVQHRRRFRQRWLVKDLAQLSYSAPRDRIRCTDKMAFAKRYFGVSKLGPREKRLIRRILGKQQQMEQRLGPHP
jgi:heptose I phosphotransferase